MYFRLCIYCISVYDGKFVGYSDDVITCNVAKYKSILKKAIFDKYMKFSKSKTCRNKIAYSTRILLGGFIFAFVYQIWKEFIFTSSFSIYSKLKKLWCCRMVFTTLYTCIKWQGHGVALNSFVRDILLLNASKRFNRGKNQWLTIYIKLLPGRLYGIEWGRN